MRNNPSGKRPPVRKGVLGRVIKSVFHFYPAMMTVALLCIIFNAVVSSLPSIFMQQIFAVIEEAIKDSTVPAASVWAVYGGKVVTAMCILIGLYVLSLISCAVYKQLMAIITQGYLNKMRDSMFNGMQDLPIRYFDTHNHGDIMSYYTNDIDTLRQMVSESMPQLLTSAIMVLTLFGIMIYYSIWLTLIVLAGIAFIILVTKIVGGGAAKYFIGQQRAVAKAEGFIEEYMNGQKVVKVFCHEE